MKRIFALVLSFAVLFSCLVLPAGAMFDPTPVYQVQAQSAYIVNTDTNIIGIKALAMLCGTGPPC